MEILKLKPIERGVYLATIHGKPAVVAFRRRNRQSDDTLHNSVTFNPAQIRHANAAATKAGYPAWVAVEIQLKGKHVYGFAMPADAEHWGKMHTSAADFPMSEKAREIYSGSDAILKGFRAEEVAADKPAPEAKELPLDKPLRAMVREAKAAQKEAPATVHIPATTTVSLEQQIAHIQETRGLSRKGAMQFIRREAAKKEAKS